MYCAKCIKCIRRVESWHSTGLWSRSQSSSLSERLPWCFHFFPHLPPLTPDAKEEKMEKEHRAFLLALGLWHLTKERKPTGVRGQERAIWRLWAHESRTLFRHRRAPRVLEVIHREAVPTQIYCHQLTSSRRGERQEFTSSFTWHGQHHCPFALPDPLPPHPTPHKDKEPACRCHL